jgi:hypothetical protein
MPPVNNYFPASNRSLISQRNYGFALGLRGPILVNKPVHTFSLSDWERVLESNQFIERAEMGGGIQQSAVERFKDNPR